MGCSRPAAIIGWEHALRELLPALLLLRELESRGHAGSLRHVRNLPRPGPADITFLPFFHDDSVAERFLFRGIDGRWIVNLAFEQMHAPCARDFLLPSGDLAVEKVLHCAWGPRFERLLRERGVPADHIFRTGHPRFELYGQPALLDNRVNLARRFGLRENAPWVLAATSFNRADFPARLWRSITNRGFRFDPRMPERARAARSSFVRVLDIAAERRPDADFILRMHPAGYEDTTEYDRLDRHPNIRRVSEDDIAAWITQAALMLVWTSTSAMEAIAAGVPVISHAPSPPDDVIEIPLHEIVPTYRDVEETVEAIIRVPDVRLEYSETVYDDWYGYGLDGAASTLIADIVDAAASDFGRLAVRGGGLRARRAFRRVQAGLRNVRSRGAWGWSREIPTDRVLAAARTLDSSPVREWLR